MSARGRFRKLTSRKNDQRQWVNAYQPDDMRLTRFFVPLHLKPQLLADGLAWHYKDFANEQPKAERLRYTLREEDAKQRLAGLWREAGALPPWEWRSKRKASSLEQR